MRGDAADWPLLPFCSKRCRTIDLGRWLGEGYRVPDEPARADSGDTEDDAELP